ncbi:hydrogenase-4 component H [Symbiobacterium terraclitae]|uniref:Hydrogenase-4 component H n=1 Tax=Symbiobacterium terraclitae TaxID=557451 RepID=A0ABS4JVH7_9FIRM|nr:hydrogenase-4 component H [Symbiobacterium terraclitae]
MFIAKLRQLALVARAGRVTLPYPASPHPPAAGFRGLPTVLGEECVGCGACAAACPARLIALATEGEHMVLSADFTRCTYCARCQDVCPTGAFQMTDRFETATADRRNLTLRVVLQAATCASCGRPFAAERLVRRAAAQAGESGPEVKLLDLCPDCRRKAHATRLKGVARRA